MVRSRKITNRIKQTTRLEKFKKHYLSSNQKHASTQTLGSMFLDRIRKDQNSKNESDLLKLTAVFC